MDGFELRNDFMRQKFYDINQLPFSFIYDSKPFSEIAANITMHESSSQAVEGGMKKVISCQCSRTGLVVACEIITYDFLPVAEWTLYFENTSTEDTPIIENIQAIHTHIGVEDDPSSQLHHHPILHHFIGSPCALNDFEPRETHMSSGEVVNISTRGGRSSNNHMPYFNIENINTGIVLAIGWPGQWSSEFKRISIDGKSVIQITAGQSKTHFKLLPGEKLRTPRIALLFYQGGFINGQNQWRRWMREYNQPKAFGDRIRPMVSACNGNYYDELLTDADTEILFLDGYLNNSIDINCWWQDAGWYPCTAWRETGTWECDPVRFPNGLKEVSDYCHSRGMRTMVWFEPERVHPASWLYKNKPDWIIRLNESGSGLLKIGDDQCRAWLIDKVHTLLKDNAIDIYRQDFNMDPLLYWEKEDTEDRQGVAEILHVTGYLAYWDALLEKNPGMFIDTCSSGGRRLDIETLKRSVPMLRSDTTFVPDSDQCQTYGLSFLVPFQGSGFMTFNEYSLRSVMLPEYTMGADTRKEDIDYQLLRQAVAEWKRIASLMLEGDYYPLTSYTLKDTAWIAWQFHQVEKDEGFVQIFRRKNCPHNSAIHKLFGLYMQETYVVENLDGGIHEFTGEALMNIGVPVNADEAPKAIILHYKNKKNTV